MVYSEQVEGIFVFVNNQFASEHEPQPSAVLPANTYDAAAHCVVCGKYGHGLLECMGVIRVQLFKER